MAFEELYTEVLEEFASVAPIPSGAYGLRDLKGYRIIDEVRQEQYALNWKARNPLRAAEMNRRNVAKWRAKNPEKCAQYKATYQGRKQAEYWAARRATGCTCKSRNGHASFCALSRGARSADPPAI